MCVAHRLQGFRSQWLQSGSEVADGHRFEFLNLVSPVDRNPTTTGPKGTNPSGPGGIESNGLEGPDGFVLFYGRLGAYLEQRSLAKSFIDNI